MITDLMARALRMLEDGNEGARVGGNYFAVYWIGDEQIHHATGRALERRAFIELHHEWGFTNGYSRVVPFDTTPAGQAALAEWRKKREGSDV